jgi:hypothetical protein
MNPKKEDLLKFMDLVFKMRCEQLKRTKTPGDSTLVLEALVDDELMVFKGLKERRPTEYYETGLSDDE